jgi:hypothetical protein
LAYSGMMAKELSALSGIKKHTPDNYLNTHHALPPDLRLLVDTAEQLRLARALKEQEDEGLGRKWT